MHFEVMVEDQSGKRLIEILMDKLLNGRTDVTYNMRYFKGIGGFTKKNTVKDTKTGKLLDDMATLFRGYDKSLRGIDSSIIVVVDNDTRDVDSFREEMESVVERNSVFIDHAICIAVEEMEAWLLGDQEALLKAYPRAKKQVLNSYVQDEICGTWEKLADAICKGGSTGFKKKYKTYMEVGEKKSEWAVKIGEYMTITENKSPSFQNFVYEIQSRLP